MYIGIKWVKESYQKTEKYFHGAYFNFTDAECQDLFKSNSGKLLEIKKKYDNYNLFCNTNNTIDSRNMNNRK